jgi:hypothetical protein
MSLWNSCWRLSLPPSPGTSKMDTTIIQCAVVPLQWSWHVTQNHDMQTSYRKNRVTWKQLLMNTSPPSPVILKTHTFGYQTSTQCLELLILPAATVVNCLCLSLENYSSSAFGQFFPINLFLTTYNQKCARQNRNRWMVTVFLHTQSVY